MPKRSLSRRVALISAAAAAGAVAVPFVARSRSTPPDYVFSGPAGDRALGLVPPSACAEATPRQTEGPFYTPRTPLTARLREPDTRGEPLILQGLVLAPDCAPLAGAVIDIWHCDEDGRYDNAGFRYRGHQFTDAAGVFRFETIRPGNYTGRTPHIHVKVQGPSTRLLTSQLYFPDMAERNARDFIYRDGLLLRLSRDRRGWLGRFDFTLASA